MLNFILIFYLPNWKRTKFCKRTLNRGVSIAFNGCCGLGNCWCLESWKNPHKAIVEVIDVEPQSHQKFVSTIDFCHKDIQSYILPFSVIFCILGFIPLVNVVILSLFFGQYWCTRKYIFCKIETQIWDLCPVLRGQSK